MDTDTVYDLLDAAAKQHPMKALAPEIDKAESTLRNELTRQPGYKLGLSTVLLILEKTGNLDALNEIEKGFNRVALTIPRTATPNFIPLLDQVGKLSKEFGECVAEISKSLEDDGEVSGAEIDYCLKETEDLVEACVQMKGWLSHLKCSRTKKK